MSIQFSGVSSPRSPHVGSFAVILIALLVLPVSASASSVGIGITPGDEIRTGVAATSLEIALGQDTAAIENGSQLIAAISLSLKRWDIESFVDDVRADRAASNAGRMRELILHSGLIMQQAFLTFATDSTSVPEPGTATMLGLGMIALAAQRKRARAC